MEEIIDYSDLSFLLLKVQDCQFQSEEEADNIDSTIKYPIPTEHILSLLNLQFRHLADALNPERFTLSKSKKKDNT